MITNFRPPSFLQYDGMAPGAIGGFAIGDMFVFADSEVSHEESSLFYNLLLSTATGPGNVVAQCESREMFVAADNRSMVVCDDPREMTA